MLVEYRIVVEYDGEKRLAAVTMEKGKPVAYELANGAPDKLFVDAIQKPFFHAGRRFPEIWTTPESKG